MTCPMLDHAVVASVAGLFACTPSPLPRDVAQSASDRETARRLLALALSLEGVPRPLAEACTLIPAGALKMELRRLDARTRAVIATAMFAASAGDLCWSLRRVSDAFGCPHEDVRSLLAAVSAAACRGPSRDLKRGLDNLVFAAAHAHAG